LESHPQLAAQKDWKKRGSFWHADCFEQALKPEQLP